MRGLKTLRSATTIIAGHAFIQNLRRGHYGLGLEARHSPLRLAAALGELARASDPSRGDPQVTAATRPAMQQSLLGMASMSGMG